MKTKSRNSSGQSPMPVIATNGMGWIHTHPSTRWIVISPPGLQGYEVPPPANDLASAA